MFERHCYLTALLMVVLYGAVACGPSPEQQLAEGHELYISECATCHQPNGEGFVQVYPPLAGNPVVMLHDPNPTIEVVLHGRGSMPPFRNELSPEELAKIISYVRSAWGNNASTVSPTQVR